MDCRRKNFLLVVCVLSLVLVCGCGGKKESAAGDGSGDSIEICHIDTVPLQNGPDRTVYGRGDDFGMSTFTLLTDEGREYDVTRVSEAGVEGRILGTVAPGHRYAMLIGEDGESLRFLINLDELEQFVGDQYYLYNGQLVLTLDGNREWVDVLALSSQEFQATGKSGKSYMFHK